MKANLSTRFSKAVKTYEKWAVPQKYTAQKLAELVSNSGHTLDVGCGTGFVSHFLEKKALSLTGLDISPKMVEAYRQRFSTAVIGDAENLPFRDKSFDTVVSNFSLHWTRVDKSLHEALRVARNTLLISLPIKGSLEGLEFPYPSEGEILGTLSGYKILISDIREVDIPFKDWELVRFFHYTGSSFNPKLKTPASRRSIEKLIKKINKFSFRVIFLYVEL